MIKMFDACACVTCGDIANIYNLYSQMKHVHHIGETNTSKHSNVKPMHSQPTISTHAHQINRCSNVQAQLLIPADHCP